MVEDEKNKVLKEVYGEINSIRLATSIEDVDVYRMHPKLWSQWCDLEDEVDTRFESMTHDQLYDWKTKVLKIWNRVYSSVLGELEMVAGQVPPAKEVPWALSFTQDKRKPREVCEVGFITWSELDLYFKKKITVRDLQILNLEDRTKKSQDGQLIGPVGLGNDGTGKRRLSEVGIPALQKSALLAPDFVTEKKTQPEKPAIIGLDLELDEGEEELELGDITVAWD